MNLLTKNSTINKLIKVQKKFELFLKNKNYS